MTMQVNKDGADWVLVKSEINTRIKNLMENMLHFQPPEMYHQYRGAVLALRELIEWVEPTTPPKSTEDDYGISDPSRENYS